MNELTREMQEAFKITVPSLSSYEIEVDKANKFVLVKPENTVFLKDLQVRSFNVGDFNVQVCYPLENHGFAHLDNAMGSIALWLSTKL